jgi:hypothetical protein
VPLGLVSKSARESRNSDGERLEVRRDGGITPLQNVNSQNYSAGVKRDKMTLEQEVMLTSFYTQSTADPPSGTDRETRDLEITKHEWKHELYGSYPAMLRHVADAHPQLLTKHQGGSKQTLTKFQASLRASVAQARQAGFDPTKEKADRFAAARRAYFLEVGRKATRIPRVNEEVSREAAALVKARETLTDTEFTHLLMRSSPSSSTYSWRCSKRTDCVTPETCRPTLAQSANRSP